jgi:hypothetical protein
MDDTHERLMLEQVPCQPTLPELTCEDGYVEVPVLGKIHHEDCDGTGEVLRFPMLSKPCFNAACVGGKWLKYEFAPFYGDTCATCGGSGRIPVRTLEAVLEAAHGLRPNGWTAVWAALDLESADPQGEPPKFYDAAIEALGKAG